MPKLSSPLYSKFGAYFEEMSLRLENRWWSRPMNEVFKVNFCILISGSGDMPPSHPVNFKSSETIFKTIYCIVTDETEWLIVVSERDKL